MGIWREELLILHRVTTRSRGLSVLCDRVVSETGCFDLTSVSLRINSSVQDSRESSFHYPVCGSVFECASVAPHPFLSLP